MLRSYWARHWACAVDVMEMLSIEAAFCPSREQDVAGAEVAEKAFGTVKALLVQLISEQYIPGGQYRMDSA